MSDFYVKTRIGLSLRDKRLFEITEVEITRVDCILRKRNADMEDWKFGVDLVSLYVIYLNNLKNEKQNNI